MYHRAAYATLANEIVALLWRHGFLKNKTVAHMIEMINNLNVFELEAIKMYIRE